MQPYFDRSSLLLQASEKELQRVIRLSVLMVGVLGASLAFLEDSVFALWIVSGDLIYCLILPQLICVLHFGYANTYGAISGYIVGLVLRGLSGEPLLGIPPVILYPGWREKNGVITQYFPFRTVSMLASLLCIPTVSYLVHLVFSHHMLAPSWDFLGVFAKRKEAEEEEIPVSPEISNGICNTKL